MCYTDEIASPGFIFPVLLFLIIIRPLTAEVAAPEIEISIPTWHPLLSGDLRVEIRTSSSSRIRLQLSRFEGNTIQRLTNVTVYPTPNLTTVAELPCGYFSQIGKYYVLVRPENGSAIANAIDVRWSEPMVRVPGHVRTYPSIPVTAIVEFPQPGCSPIPDRTSVAVPDFRLELRYCGHTIAACDVPEDRNRTYQVLHTEQLRFTPGVQNITLSCELFGLAGHYALIVKPKAIPSQWSSYEVSYLKADWSEEFVFNVHAQSIFPCDNHDGGVTVLFQYPACISEKGDRVRVYARNRANVASLAPPTTLEYVAEQRVARGTNKLKFGCDLFSEHFIEYCFVYVSQAITGAVADVRMNCVPTLPLKELRNGGWGAWSAWTPCSSTCVGGTRSRYRLCDEPQPKFGGKFCEGNAVETEKCGGDLNSVWECFDGSFNSLDGAVADATKIKEEVGLYCRCGCVVHLGRANPKRILATSSRSCPGRIFWQIQADTDCVVQFRIDWVDSYCGVQWLKIHDGMSLASTLLADLSNVLGTRTSVINSTGSTMLLEFYSDESTNAGQPCGGGFLAYARQLESHSALFPIIEPNANFSPFVVSKLTAVHSTSIFFLSGILIAMALLGAQYTFRYRKYQIAFTEEQDAVSEMSGSCSSLTQRRASNSTLLSEILPLQYLERIPEVESEGTSSTGTNQEEKETENPEENEKESRDDASKEASSPSSSSEPEKPAPKDETIDNPKLAPSRGKFSSSRRVISTATIRATIPKEAKEKTNRAKLLAGPSGSDFSISGNENDLEIDYYDYNVRNAGAAPGSYLGMDPAFLIYIPPLYETGETTPSTEELDENKFSEIDDKAITYDSKIVRLKLQVTEDGDNKKTKYEEFPMIDSNILDEIKYADDDEDEKH